MSAGASAVIYVPVNNLRPALEAAWLVAQLPGQEQPHDNELVLPNGESVTTPFKFPRWNPSAPVEKRQVISHEKGAVQMSFQFWAPRPENSEWMELDKIKVRGVRCFRFPVSFYVQSGKEFASLTVSVDGSGETLTFAHESSLSRLAGIADAGNSVGGYVNLDGGLSLRDSDFDFVDEAQFNPYETENVDLQARKIIELLEAA